MTEPCYTVSSLNRELRTLLEKSYPTIRIRGEISNLRRQASGHTYFTLKDGQSAISGVLFRGDAARVKTALRDGMEVVGTGRLGLYEPRGTYQIIFRTLEEDGVGRLQQAFERLKKKLLAEGLFDRSRKRPIPRLPATIGYVTSPSGAAIRDFISILQKRQWTGRLIVIPARVQGAEAAPEIARGIELANRKALCDLLIVGRGGGSLEDLWPFNEEIVSRAIAASAIPVISAVGHETDTTLSDFAADLRCETPSAAAEWITSARQALAESLLTASSRMQEVSQRALERRLHRIQLAASSLLRQHPQHRIDQANLRIDDLQNRLRQSLFQQVLDRKHAVATCQNRLAAYHPRHRFEVAGIQVRDLWRRLNAALSSSLERRRWQGQQAAAAFNRLQPERSLKEATRNLEQLKLRLRANSHEGTLKRGFAMLRNPGDGTVYMDQDAISASGEFTVDMRDGSFAAHRIDRPPPLSASS